MRYIPNAVLLLETEISEVLLSYFILPSALRNERKYMGSMIQYYFLFQEILNLHRIDPSQASDISQFLIRPFKIVQVIII